MLLSTASILSLILPLGLATSLVISIPPSILLPNPNVLTSSTHAAILSCCLQLPPLTAPLTTRSTFEFNNFSFPDTALGPQSYLLIISALTHVFAPYRVDVIPGGPNGGAVVEGAWETYGGSPWSDRGPIIGGKAMKGGVASESTSSIKVGQQDHEQGLDQVVRIEAKVLAKREFYEERAGFNPLGLLMNPMLLLGVAAMVVTFGMPYLMDNMDPELRADFEEQKTNSPLSGMHRALQDAAVGGGSSAAGVGGSSNFDLASWMAGAQKPQRGVTSGADVMEGEARRR